MRLVVYKVALEPVFLPVLLFPLSVSFHQCSTLIFIYMLLLLEGQTGEAWKPSKKRCSFRYVSAALYRPVPSHPFVRPRCLLTVMQSHLTNWPQSADSNLAIVYLLPFTVNRAPPYATNRFTQLIAGTCKPAQPVMYCQELWQCLVCVRAS